MPSPPAQRRPPATESLAAMEDGFSYIYCTDTRRKRIGRFEASFHVASLQTARHLCPAEFLLRLRRRDSSRGRTRHACLAKSILSDLQLALVATMIEYFSCPLR